MVRVHPAVPNKFNNFSQISSRLYWLMRLWPIRRTRCGPRGLNLQTLYRMRAGCLLRSVLGECSNGDHGATRSGDLAPRFGARVVGTLLREISGECSTANRERFDAPNFAKLTVG